MYLWYEVFFIVFAYVNLAVLIFFLIPLLFQVFSLVIALFSKKKKYKKADRQVKIAYIIPACNEEEVIFDTVRDILDNQEYPKELISVYVVADNCSDSTAKKAQVAGAKVLIHNDKDINHHQARYPLKFGIDYILENDKEAELIIHADADNHFNKEFSQKMNDAYVTKGYDFLRPYEGALNGTHNFYTRACSFFYAYDSRVGARSREILHLGQHIQGSGATMSRRMLLKCNGYDSDCISDDADFCFKRMLDGIKGHFVEEAVVFEDMPSTGIDTAKRNSRIKKGVKELYQKDVSKMPKMFFKTGDFTYLEVPLTYTWLFIGAPFFIWAIIFCGLFFSFAGLSSASNIIPLSHFDSDFFKHLLMMILNVSIVVAISIAVLFLFGMNTILLTDYKKFGAKKRSEMISFTIFLPLYLMVYAFSLNERKYSKKGWEKIKRNTK